MSLLGEHIIKLWRYLVFRSLGYKSNDKDMLYTNDKTYGHIMHSSHLSHHGDIWFILHFDSFLRSSTFILFFVTYLNVYVYIWHLRTFPISLWFAVINLKSIFWFYVSHKCQTLNKLSYLIINIYISKINLYSFFSSDLDIVFIDVKCKTFDHL